MPDRRTVITEVVTGLGMADASNDLDALLEHPPASLANVTAPVLEQLRAARRSGRYHTDFEAAWNNGKRFYFANDGLRGRQPRRIEWRGPAKPPAYEAIPADLRVDHVYLISCKHLSRIIANSSPSNLFDLALSERQASTVEWYLVADARAYQKFYSSVRSWIAEEYERYDLPVEVSQLDPHARQILHSLLPRGRAWPVELREQYTEFSHAIAAASATRWNRLLATAAKREVMLWRLLRLASAPYFMLGMSDDGPIALRVMTPWDWRQSFRLLSFHAWPDFSAGQPLVRWQAAVERLAGNEVTYVDGHVEIRWSHGRFGGSCEAKIYLDTPFAAIPGYVPIA